LTMKAIIISINFIYITLTVMPLCLVMSILYFILELLNMFTIKGLRFNKLKFNNGIIKALYNETKGIMSTFLGNLKEIKELY